MSRINSLTTPSTNTQTPPKRTNDIKDLDINEFLQLMITELTNQDPLNPLDNTELVQQLGHIRSIAATTQLSDTLAVLQTGQSLTTASGLIGKKVTALTDGNQNITGVVDRVSVEVDPNDNNERTYRVHIGDQRIDLRNVREIKS